MRSFSLFDFHNKLVLTNCILLQNLPNLEQLDLSHSKKLIECPNVSGSPNLKDVRFGGCESLPEVDSSIFLLQKLEYLCVAKCTSLESLSSNTCSPAFLELNATHCVNLKELSIPFPSVDRLGLALTDWAGNELPSSILHKKNLRSFVFPISDCLVDLPENFSDRIWLVHQKNHKHDPFITLDKVLSSPAFPSVKVLIFSNIPILSEIPNSISLLSSLEFLTLIGMDIRSLPETIKYLPQLISLNVYDCKMLQSIPTLSQFIPILVFWNCESLEEVTVGEPYDKPNLALIVLLNCKKLHPHSYQKVLKDVMVMIEFEARQSKENEEARDDIIWHILPAIHGLENWFHYPSTQVSFTLELPHNLLGFAYYLVLSEGQTKYNVGFGCECYLNNSLGERICITSFTRAKFFGMDPSDTLIHMMSDHVVLWYDPISCKKIMEEVKAINDVNNTGYNPKLTFTFFIDETLYDEVEIKECGFRWLYGEEIISSTISEFHDQEENVSSSDFQYNDKEEIVPPTNFDIDDLEETIPPTNKLKLDFFGAPPSNLELAETYDLRYIFFIALIILII